jgi:hypothetical protein
MKTLHLTASIFMMFILSHEALHAQSLFEKASNESTTLGKGAVTLNGYARGSVYGAGENYDFTNAFSEVSLKTGIKTGKFIATADIRFRTGYAFNQAFNEMELKEAYAGYSSSAFDLLLGNQIVSWGRTDGFNPTNNINPVNYFFFTGNPDDQKTPNLMLRTNWRITPIIDWEVIAIPVFKPSHYRYDFFDMGENTSFAKSSLPEKNFENASLATRVNFELSSIGFSLSWFNGYDPFYGFNVQDISFDTGEPVITNAPAYYRKNTIGFDMALPIGPVIWRNEAAYNFTENENDEIYIPEPGPGYVSALEYNTGNVIILLQYIGKFVPGFNALEEPVLTDPSNPPALMQYATETIYYQSALFNRKIFQQEEEFHHALSATLTGRFFRETFNVECTGYYDITTEEYMVKPKIELKVGNGLSLSAGYNYMHGPEGSIFNYASPVINGAFIECKASF